MRSTPKLPTLLICVLAFAALDLPLTAQCKGPVPPPGGFAVTENLNLPVTYSDLVTTKIDVRYPTVAPGPCGWPVILVVHGLGQNRQGYALMAQRLASEGFLTATYDVRGQGDAGGGTKLLADEELIDMAEIVNFISSNYGTGSPPTADVSRLGITGLSQGAWHSWAAAAWSGKTLPPNSRGVMQFPVFKASFPLIHAPTKDTVPQGKAFETGLCLNILIDGLYGFKLDPTFKIEVRAKILSEDFQGLEAYFKQDPFRQVMTELKTSTVPVFVRASWQDKFATVGHVWQALSSLPASTHRRAFFGAAGDPAHGTPANAYQSSRLERFTTRWFNRFLKGTVNQVEIEPTVVCGVIPETAAKHTNGASLFWNRYHDSWPPPRTSEKRYYLRSGNALTPQAPGPVEPPDRITHAVAAGFNMFAFIYKIYTSASATMISIPLSSVAYDTAPLAKDVEIAGSSKVRLEVTPGGNNFQVHCALYQVAPNNDERFLGSGMGLVRAGAPAPMTLDVTTIALNARLKAGDRIRLRVENLTLRRQPASTTALDNLWVAPYFESTWYDVEHSSSRPSWIDLPLRHVVQPALMSATLEMPISSPSKVSYTLEAPNHPRSRYILLFGTSGISCPLQLPGSDPLRLVFPWRPGRRGVLDAEGSASAQLKLTKFASLPGKLRGIRLDAAGVVVSRWCVLASNPVPLYLK